jgi:hypothetical protein
MSAMKERAGERPIRCAYLTHYPYWPGEALLACPGLELVALHPSVLGLPSDQNPFGLPEDDRADVALVTAWWHRWLVARHPDRADQVMRDLERRANVLVGVDGPDRFALTFPPRDLKRFEIVLKLQGIYHDRDLYNYAVGPQFAGALPPPGMPALEFGDWTGTLRPTRSRYDGADLEKLRLSVPCYVTEFPAIRRRFRAWETQSASWAGRRISPAERFGRDLGETVVAHAMGFAGGHGRPLEVHCLTGLTHVQRIEAVRVLDGFSGTRGIVAIDGSGPARLSGTSNGEDGLPGDVAGELSASASKFSRMRVGRFRFLLDLRRHRVGVAPTGYGELGNRHGAVLLSGAALVCQDLSHVEMMLPLKDGDNVVFCRPDLSDLRERVDWLLSDDAVRIRIGRAGRRSYMDWAGGWRDHLREGIEAHIIEAVQGK